VGERVGLSVGERVGLNVGCSIVTMGELVGVRVGLNVGEVVGLSVGCPSCPQEFPTLGLNVGLRVGKKVGLSVLVLGTDVIPYPSVVIPLFFWCPSFLSLRSPPMLSVSPLTASTAEHPARTDPRRAYLRYVPTIILLFLNVSDRNGVQ